MEETPERTNEEDIYAVDRVLSLALDIAEKMLEKGAQVQRAEETVVRICLAYGAKQVEPFAINTLLQATVCMPDGYHTTQIRRVYQTSTDLGKLERLAKLVDRVVSERPTPEAVQSELQAISESKSRALWMDFVGMPLGAGAFAIFFGGGIWDGVAAALIGAVLAGLNLLLTSRILNAVARTALSALVGGLLAIFLCAVGLGKNPDSVMMGTIMLLITGILFGNALRDLLCGDLIAGILKCIQAFISAFAIAAGYSVALWLGGLLP